MIPDVQLKLDGQIHKAMETGGDLGWSYIVMASLVAKVIAWRLLRFHLHE